MIWNQAARISVKQIARGLILYGLGGLMVAAIIHTFNQDMLQYTIEAQEKPSFYWATRAR
jgi:hypothetical protein